MVLGTTYPSKSSSLRQRQGQGFETKPGWLNCGRLGYLDRDKDKDKDRDRRGKDRDRSRDKDKDRKRDKDRNEKTKDKDKKEKEKDKEREREKEKQKELELQQEAEKAIAEAAAKAEAEKPPSRSCSRESRDSTDMPKRPTGHQASPSPQRKSHSTSGVTIAPPAEEDEVHDGITCSGCHASPIRGDRFKCCLVLFANPWIYARNAMTSGLRERSSASWTIGSSKRSS
eukprot:symbB.v1.2.000293.t1/scaffold24.1/size427761/9